MTTETMTDQERSDATYAARRERIQRIMDGYECSTSDTELLLGHRDYGTKPMRWVLVENNTGWGYFLTGCGDRTDDPARIVNDHHANGFEPVCIYDLDQLDGDEPLPDIGDTVCILGDDQRTPLPDGDSAAGTWYVVDHSGTSDEGEGTFRKCDLARDENDDPTSWHTSDFLRVLERAEPDERMPVCYLLARMFTFVAFDTTPAR